VAELVVQATHLTEQQEQPIAVAVAVVVEAAQVLAQLVVLELFI
jgi:hypothetical protein